MSVRATRGEWRWYGAAVLAALAVAAQLWGLYRVAGPPSPAWFPQVDKLQHAVGFALPVALVLLALGLRRLARGGRPSRRAPAVVGAVFAAHGVVSEVLQHSLATGRTGDPLDVLADWAGVAAGALVAVALLGRATRQAPVPVGPAAEPSPAGAS